MDYVRKNGLLYTEDMRTIVAVDSQSGEFMGRVPFGAHYIEDEVFADSNCESISLPDSVEQIGVCLFQNSTVLEKVKLPVNLTELSPYLFAGCTALQKVTMPTVVSAFTEGLFYNCSSLLDIPFRAGIKELPEFVFSGCSSIQSLVIPETVEKISSKAVENCTSLTTVVLPAALYELADDAFDGCNAITKVRISEANRLFYVNEEDGCLYERTADGDKCKIKVIKEDPFPISFFKENVDEETDSFYTDEGAEDEDDTFSSEVGAGEEELAAVEPELIDEIEGDYSEMESVTNNTEESKDSNIDDMLADIMGEEKARNERNDSDVSVSEKESQVLSEMMDCMNDKPNPSDGAKVTEEELERLFSAHETEEAISNQTIEDLDDASGLDSKTQILVDSVKVSKIIDCEPKGPSPVDADLFILAELTVQNENGEEGFTEKLEKCARRFAEIQDMKRVIMLGGIPTDNDEFMQFFYNYIRMRNVVLACTAPSPSKMSEYAKLLCEGARIDLDKESLIDQRKKISIKNDNLIKLVIQDLPNS